MCMQGITKGLVSMLERVKLSFEIGEKPRREYKFTKANGEVIDLNEEDVEEIAKFYRFRKTYGFLAWLKYNIKQKTGST